MDGGGSAPDRESDSQSMRVSDRPWPLPRELADSVENGESAFRRLADGPASGGEEVISMAVAYDDPGPFKPDFPLVGKTMETDR